MENLSKVSGIYFFFMPKSNTGYVGRTQDLSKRYREHTLIGSHKKEIKDYSSKYDDLEYMVLQFTKDYKIKDQAKVEKFWIERLKKGIL